MIANTNMRNTGANDFIWCEIFSTITFSTITFTKFACLKIIFDLQKGTPACKFKAIGLDDWTALSLCCVSIKTNSACNLMSVFFYYLSKHLARIFVWTSFSLHLFARREVVHENNIFIKF